MKITGTVEEVIHILSNLDRDQKVEVSIKFNINTSEDKNVSGKKDADEMWNDTAGRNGKWKDTPMSLKIKKKMLIKGINMTELARTIGISKSSLAITIYEKRKGETYNKYLNMILEVLEIKERKNKIA